MFKCPAQNKVFGFLTAWRLHPVPEQIVGEYSISGAAVSADTLPELGTMLIVGRIIGRVVRHFPEGFAIEFIMVHDFQTVNKLFTKPQDRS